MAKTGPKIGTKWTKEHKQKISHSMMGKRNALNRGNGFHISRNGYVIICRNGITIPEHRLVMEQKLGRKLNKSEVVHHINSIKTDNRPKNLVVISHSENVKKHHDLVRELIKKYKQSLTC